MAEWIEGRTAMPVDVIQRWREAYQAANGEPAPYSMHYERGWFIMRNPTSRFRRLQVLDMISRLEARTAAP